jgi:hypothetical protein
MADDPLESLARKIREYWKKRRPQMYAELERTGKLDEQIRRVLRAQPFVRAEVKRRLAALRAAREQAARAQQGPKAPPPSGCN